MIVAIAADFGSQKGTDEEFSSLLQHNKMASASLMVIDRLWMGKHPKLISYHILSNIVRYSFNVSSDQKTCCFVVMKVGINRIVQVYMAMKRSFPIQ